MTRRATPTCRLIAAHLPMDTDFPTRASAALEPREAAQASRVRHPVRRRQWLAARLLAKRLAGRCAPFGEVGPGAPLAVSDLAADEAAPAIARRWTVVAADGGAPELLEDGAPSATRLSLAHAGDLVVAAVSPCRVGADVERVAPDLPGWAMSSFPRAEAAWVASAPGREALLTTVLWSVKECLLKTGACGPVAVARIAPLEVRPLLGAEEACRLVARGVGWAPFPVDPQIEGGVEVQSFVQLVEGMVLAVVVLGPDEFLEQRQ